MKIELGTAIVEQISFAHLSRDDIHQITRPQVGK